MNISTTASSAAFSQRVFVTNSPRVVEQIGDGRVCFDGPIDGPTLISIRRENSDAAIAAMAARFGVDAPAMLSFRDTSNVGDLIELAPHRLDA